MYQMKKIRFRKIFLFGIIFSAVNALAADTLFIKFNNGNATETITKASFKKITFPSGSQMLVDKIDGSSSSFTIADVRTLRFGKGAILLGDDKSDANSSLSFLTDGGYTISNSLVQGTMDSSITMSVGGNSTTVASRLTSNLLLSRALCLHSAGGDVTFSGAITGTGGITKTGVGTVYLTGVVSNTGPTVVQAGSLVVQSNVTLTNTLTVAAGTGVTATLAVTGNVTLGTGATLAVSAGSLVRGQTYTFMTWTGTQTGTFAPTTGLPENWRVKYLSNSAVLYYAPPGTMIRVL